MKNRRLLTIVFTAALILVAPPKAQAAKLTFDPVSYTASPGASFDIRIRIDTQGVKTTTANAYIPYDATLLEVTAITAGDFYPANFKNIGESTLAFGGSVNSPTDTRTGTGILATLTMRGKKTGSIKLRLDCTPGLKTDTNITQNDNDGTDVLDCSQLVAGTYSFSTGASAPPAPVTTTAPASPSATLAVTKTPTPTPAQLPVTGDMKPTTILFGFAATVFVAGIALLF